MNIILLLCLFIKTYSLSTDFYRYWNCIGIKEKIDFQKPYSVHIGELPLVVWKNPITDKYVSTINICKHMGSKLDNGEITKNGCLQCKYHGYENTYQDRFGEVYEHDGKLFWAYKPFLPHPPSLPFYRNTNFKRSFIEFDMECSLPDSAFNTMDLRHPEFVHSGLFGFGNSIPPQNVKHYQYSKYMVGLAFDYMSKRNIQNLNANTKFTKNFHMFVYPSFSWSKVTFDKTNHLMIGVNLLPLAPKKTRWYITICHNYFTNALQQKFMQLLTFTILSQDYVQMKNQYPENALKQTILFQHTYENEDPILRIRDMLQNYTYPDISSCVELMKYQKK